MSGKYEDFSGRRFGKITVISEEKEGEKWYCFGTCDCGKKVRIRKDSLARGKTKSCGCDKRSNAKIEQLKIGRNLQDHTALCFFESNAPGKNNTSGIKGVSYIKRTKKYRAVIGYKNKTYSLGEFETIEEAQTVREKVVKMVKSGNFERWIGRKKRMKKYEFTNTGELTERAFAVYINSSFVFWKNEAGIFFYSDNPNSEKIELGTLKDVNEFLEMFA